MFDSRELRIMAVLASGVQVAYFTVLNSTYAVLAVHIPYTFEARYRRGQWTSISML